MTLSEISIRRPVFAWILMFALIFFGGLAFTQLGINDNPDVDYPVVTVSYDYPGATPKVVEKDVIEEVESVLVALQGIRNISSVAQRGSARITLEFDLSKDIDFALQEVQTTVSKAQDELPDSVNPPTVTKNNAADDPIMYLALSSETMKDRDLMILFRDRIRDQLSTIEGVAEIRALGYHEPVMRVDLRAEQLKKYALTAKDVVDNILNQHRELPAGRFEFKDSEDLIRIMGEVSEPEEFESMVISQRGGQPNYLPIKLKEVAHVYEGLEEIRRLTRVDAKPSLGMAIQKQKGVNAVATADRVKAKVAEINKELPEGVTIGINFDRSTFIRESVNELIFTLILSALLTSLICWLFLGSLSATLNIFLAIPTAIIGTFLFMYWFNFTLNTFSLLGLALAIGVVVDDAVIMLENIVRYMQMGYDRVNAAYKGSREIAFAVIATTAALVSIFIPITLLSGIEGRFFLEFALTISVAVMLSSLEALTLAPMRCSQFLDISGKTSNFRKKFDQTMDWLRDVYKNYLTKCIAYPKTVVIVAFSIVILSLGVIKLIPSEFAPAEDRGVLFLVILAPDGKSMEYTSGKVKEFEKIAMNHKAVKKVVVAIGGFGDGGQGNRGNGVVILKDRDDRELSQFDVAEDLRKQVGQIQGIKIIIRDRFGTNLGGRRGSPIEFTINGPDAEKQREYFFEIQKAMEESKMFEGARSDDVRQLPEVQIIPDRERSIARGVDVNDVAEVINIAFGGRDVAQYTKNGRRFNVFVQLKEEDRRQKKNLQPLYIRNNRGELIRLMDVVKVVEATGPESVFREDRISGLRVDSGLAEGVKQGPAIDKVKEIANRILPEKYYIRFSDTPQDKIYEFMFIMLLGLIIAYMVLAIQFNSFIDPFVVFMAVPFGLIGSLIALLMGGQTLNVFSVIGLLLTMGLVKKNSILLVEFTNQVREEGKSIKEGLLEACPVRLRPILMTTLSTLAAAIPPALAIGPGAETRVPMALTVIGGVSLSMLFTLFVVPCIYLLVSGERRKILIEKD